MRAAPRRRRGGSTANSHAEARRTRRAHRRRPRTPAAPPRESISLSARRAEQAAEGGGRLRVLVVGELRLVVAGLIVPVVVIGDVVRVDPVVHLLDEIGVVAAAD